MLYFVPLLISQQTPGQLRIQSHANSGRVLPPLLPLLQCEAIGAEFDKRATYTIGHRLLADVVLGGLLKDCGSRIKTGEKFVGNTHELLLN